MDDENWIEVQEYLVKKKYGCPEYSCFDLDRLGKSSRNLLEDYRACYGDGPVNSAQVFKLDSEE